MKTPTIILISLLLPYIAFAQHPTATASVKPAAKHYIRLHVIQESGEYLAIVDQQRAFTTVDGLKRYIAILPTGDRVVFELTCSVKNPFCDAADEIRVLCEQKQLKYFGRSWVE